MPLGTAQLASAPSRSRRKSKCSRRASWRWTTKIGSSPPPAPLRGAGGGREHLVGAGRESVGGDQLGVELALEGRVHAQEPPPRGQLAPGQKRGIGGRALLHRSPCGSSCLDKDISAQRAP